MVMEKLVVRLLLATAAAAVVLLVGCGAETGHPATSPVPLPPDPYTAAALLKIATAFNHDNAAVTSAMCANAGRLRIGAENRFAIGMLVSSHSVVVPLCTASSAPIMVRR